MVIIDVGMNVGIASIFFAARADVCAVYAFEPFEPTFKAAVRNLQMNEPHSTKVHAYPMGLGDKNELKEIPYESKNKGINSSLIQSPKMQPDSLERIVIEKVNNHLQRISSLHQENDVVLKIDTEGAEYAIFDSLADGHLPGNIKVIMLEWHFKGAETIQRYLLAQGFRVISTTPTKNAGIIYAFR